MGAISFLPYLCWQIVHIRKFSRTRIYVLFHMGDDGTSCSWWILNFLLFSVWFRLAYSGIWIFMYRRSVAYYFSRAHSQSWYYCWSSFRQCIIMRSILCSMSLSVVAQKERKTYRRRRDILRGVRFFVSDLFQKWPSWQGAADAGPLCLQKKRKKLSHLSGRALF